MFFHNSKDAIIRFEIRIYSNIFNPLNSLHNVLSESPTYRGEVSLHHTNSLKEENHNYFLYLRFSLRNEGELEEIKNNLDDLFQSEKDYLVKTNKIVTKEYNVANPPWVEPSNY